MQNTLSSSETKEANELLQWIKETVSSRRCVCLQDLSNGVIWCRLMAKLQTGSLASVLIINRPANAGDAMHNYSLLESAFNMANMPWFFVTKKLVAGDNRELFELAKCFAQLRATSVKQSRHQKLPHKSRLARRTRCPAGQLDVDLPQHLIDLRKCPAVPKVDIMDAVQPTILDCELPSILSQEQQLKQKVQTLFCNQQLAVKAFITDQHQFDTAAPIVAATTCFCSKCFRQGQNLAKQQLPEPDTVTI